MFKTRLISGIILVAIALAVIMTGGWVLFATTLILSLIGAFELFRAANVREEGKKINPLEIAGYLGIILYYISIVVQWGSMQRMALIMGLVIIMAVYVFAFPRFHSDQVMAAYFAIIYVGVMLSFVYQTRMLQDGQYIVWLIFLSSWGCDTCAYCAGRLFGRHKMAPVLRPKKTVEGGLGGVLGALILGLLYALATKGPVIEYAIICAVGGMISIIGDLAASAIKRNKGIKDYGKLIPGHGGVLDRFDSVIFTVPMIYFLAVILIQ